MKLLQFPRRTKGPLPGAVQLYPWRVDDVQRAEARLVQTAALEALARRRGLRSLRVVPPLESYYERARAAQRRGFESFMNRLGGGHLY